MLQRIPVRPEEDVAKELHVVPSSADTDVQIDYRGHISKKERERQKNRDRQKIRDRQKNRETEKK